MRGKMIWLGILAASMIVCTACGSGEGGSADLEGSLSDILTEVYENAELPEDFRESLNYYETLELNEDIEVSVLGTDAVEYTEGLVSMPMMSSVAYQCVLLRTAGDDVEAVKQQIRESADLDKWVCVSAETILVESRGDVILFVMGENDIVYALNSAFQSL